MTADSFPARIVPCVDSASSVHKTQGTEVWVGDSRLKGVTSITLHCELDDIWRATIECFVEPPAEVLAAPVLIVRKFEGFFARVLRWISGGPRDVTHLESRAREFVK